MCYIGDMEKEVNIRAYESDRLLIKVEAAKRGVNMADFIREMLKKVERLNS